MGDTDRGTAQTQKTDRLLDVLADSVRREVLRYFENDSETTVVQLDDLVAHLDKTLPHDSRQFRLGLHHVHLPKLEGAGWLDYDPRSEQIRYHGNPDVADLLDDLREMFES